MTLFHFEFPDALNDKQIPKHEYCILSIFIATADNVMTYHDLLWLPINNAKTCMGVFMNNISKRSTLFNYDYFIIPQFTFNFTCYLFYVFIGDLYEHILQ